MYMFLDEMDCRIAGWMECYGHLLLHYSLAIVFIWFGGPNPFGLSPAQARVSRSVLWFPPEIFVPILGWWEVAIGVGLHLSPAPAHSYFPALSANARHCVAPSPAARNLLYRLALRATTPVYHQKLHSY